MPFFGAAKPINSLSLALTAAVFSFLSSAGCSPSAMETSKAQTSREMLEQMGTTKRLFGYIDATGSFVIPPRFDVADDFFDGYAAIRIYAQTGYIDKTGTIVIPPQFESGGPFSEGLAAVGIHGRVAYINGEGIPVIPPKYDRGGAFSEGLAHVAREGLYGYVDLEGNVAIDFQFAAATSFRDGLALVLIKGNGYSYIDRKGTVIIGDEAWSDAEPFVGDYARVWVGETPHYIDRKGQVVAPPAPNPGGALLLYEQRLLCGYKNGLGAIVIPPRYDKAREFSEGLAAVRLQGDTLFRYIDATGATVIKPAFSSASSFHDGLARVLVEVPKD